MSKKKVILDFIYKFFCILKAASDGWIVTYIGANKFEFSGYKKNIKKILMEYTKTLPNIITDI
jgi:hypothetical protein